MTGKHQGAQSATETSQSPVYPFWSVLSKSCCRCCQIFKVHCCVFPGMCKSSLPSFQLAHKDLGVLRNPLKQTVKLWSDTRWRSRLESVHMVRRRVSEVQEALLEHRQDLAAKVAQALACRGDSLCGMMLDDSDKPCE